MDNRGFVVNASTPEERKLELHKWGGHSWFPVLNFINMRLEKLDPYYTLVQVKEKFGSLRYYIYTDTNHRKEMNEIVREGEQRLVELERQRRNFNAAAPPPFPAEKFEW
jgi:hypothetical protein